MAHLQYFSGLKMSSYLNIGEKYDFLQEIININKIKHIHKRFNTGTNEVWPDFITSLVISFRPHGRRGGYRMVVGFTTTCVVSAKHHLSCEFEPRSWRHYVIKFVSDMRQVGGFLRVLRFPPPIKLTATI